MDFQDDGKFIKIKTITASQRQIRPYSTSLSRHHQIDGGHDLNQSITNQLPFKIPLKTYQSSQEIQKLSCQKTHRNLSFLVDGMFLQFQDTVRNKGDKSHEQEEKKCPRPSSAYREKRLKVKEISQPINTHEHINIVNPSLLNNQKQSSRQLTFVKKIINPQTKLLTEQYFKRRLFSQQQNSLRQKEHKEKENWEQTEKMLQALVDKLMISKEQINLKDPLSTKVRGISSNINSKRLEKKQLKPFQDKHLVSQSFDSGNNQKLDSKKRYQIVETLGTGAYANVRKAKDTFTDKYVAIKQYENNKLNSYERRQMSYHEIRTLQKLDHPCIVKLVNVIKREQSISLVLEYTGKLSLYMVLKEKPYHRFTEIEFKPIFKQILQAVEHCHQQGITHRDIKIENILLNSNQIKLIDFGLASNDSKKYLTTYCGTPSYMPPEICSRRPYLGEKSDIWALGVVMFVSTTGKFPFEGKTDVELSNAIINQKLKLPSQMSQHSKQLLGMMLEKDSTLRPSVTQVSNIQNLQDFLKQVV